MRAYVFTFTLTTQLVKDSPSFLNSLHKQSHYVSCTNFFVFLRNTIAAHPDSILEYTSSNTRKPTLRESKEREGGRGSERLKKYLPKFDMAVYTKFFIFTPFFIFIFIKCSGWAGNPSSSLVLDFFSSLHHLLWWEHSSEQPDVSGVLAFIFFAYIFFIKTSCVTGTPGVIIATILPLTQNWRFAKCAARILVPSQPMFCATFWFYFRLLR